MKRYYRCNRRPGIDSRGTLLSRNIFNVSISVVYEFIKLFMFLFLFKLSKLHKTARNIYSNSYPPKNFRLIGTL